MTMCAQKGGRALARRKVENIEHRVLEDCIHKEIETFVARIWQEIEQQDLPKMLEDLESLKYVPVEVRRKEAIEPLFLVQNE